MKKPKKTLKDLGRIEGLLARQTSRAAKLLARRKTGDAENPVTAGYYERIAKQQTVALTDLSEITHLIETLSRQIVEADAGKAAKKAAKALKTSKPKAAPAAKPAANTEPQANTAKASPAKAKTAKASAAKRAPKAAASKAPVKRASAKTSVN
jgi:hypothetical protein